ncbi:polyprotein [Blueberry latent spherical virus]|uniref:RNA1 polyprotein n=1 Tax=Blueberry latent spherical virus TaxID=1071488 RepID=G5ELQ1_9SECO|nr:polyprotein [Blueberry latent spherical virus]BAL04700.1 polyprotein [Blueberry latent spherical virus]
MEYLSRSQLKPRGGKVPCGVVPRAVLEASRLAKTILAKPANFSLTFLAQGASLKPRSVALACANGVIATGPGFCIYTPEGIPLSWGDAARRVKPFCRALAKSESGLYQKMTEELAFRKFQRQVPHMVAASKRLSARKQASRAKGAATVAARSAAATAELEARRAAGATKKSALRRALKKKATKKVVSASAAMQRGEPTLGSIFPFSSSLFERVSVRPLGVPFNPPQREDFLSSSSPIPACPGMGIASLPLMGRILSLAPQVEQLCELCAPGAGSSFSSAVADLASSSTLHERDVFFRAMVAISQLFSAFPNAYILGNFVGFHFYNCEAILNLVEQANSMALYYICLFKQGPIVHSFLDSFSDVASHISGAARIVGNVVKNFSSSIFDSILNKCESIFFKILSPYMATLHSSKVEIVNFWKKCKDWATNLWANAHLALQGLGMYAIWALVLMILCGIVYLLETMFITAGAISSHGLLVSGFLCLVMAACGYTVFAVGKESAQMIRVMRECILMAVIPDDVVKDIAAIPAPGEQQVHSLLDAAMVPIKFLDSLASGLSLFSTSSVTVLGKLGNSLEGIRKGYNCLADFISIFLNYTGVCWEAVSGKKTSFFRDLATTVKINVANWTEDARRLIEYHEMAGLLDKFEYEKVRTLIYQGEEMVDIANKGRSSHTSTSFLRTVGSLLNDLRDVRAKCARSLRFDGWRRQPFWVYIFGASQCGKSTLANYLAPLLLTHMGWDAHDVYSKDPTESYWSGYYQQKCLKMNDLSAVIPRNNVPLEQQLIPLISTEEKMVSAAECEGKGIQFLSEIAISSSNVEDAPTAAELIDGNAYRLRRKVFLRCRRAAVWVHDDKGNRTEAIDAEGQIINRDYNPSDALDCVEVQWLHSSTGLPLPGPPGQWHMATSTIPLIKDAMDAHFLQEDIKRDAWVQQTDMKSKTGREVSSYLSGLMGALGSYKAIQRSSETSEAGERKFLVAVDGQIYSLDSQGVATLEANDAYDNVEALEAVSLNQYRLDFSKQVREHCLLTCNSSFHSSLVRDILEDMLVNDACIISVNKISRDTKQIHRDLWKELKLSERVFLRISQKALNTLREQPHFKVDLKSQILDSFAVFRDSIVDNRQKILLFLSAILLVGTLSWSFLSLMKAFLSGSVGFGGALALKNQLDVHSCAASTASVATSVYSSNSIPIVWAQAARYANVHSCLEENHNFKYFEDGLAHLLVRLVGSSGISENAILYGPRSIALCAHQIRLFPDHDRVQIHYLDRNHIPKCFNFTWHYGNALEQDDTEVCIYRDDQLTPLPVYSRNLYIPGGEKLASAVNINGVCIKKRKFFHADSLTQAERQLDGETPIIRSWSNVGALCTSKQTISNPKPGVAYSRTLNRYLNSTYASGVHDSGGLITTIKDGVRKVVGLHVAGTQEGHLFKSTVAFLPTGSFADIHSGEDFFVPESGIETAGYVKIGYIKNPALRPHVSTTSQIGRVTPNLCIPLPTYNIDDDEHFVDADEVFEIKENAILSKKDERLKDLISNPEAFNPLQDGMVKFANPMLPLDEEILEKVCDDMFDTWYDMLPQTDMGAPQFLQKVDLDIALNGIPDDACMEAMKLDTSEGYPHCVERAPGESGKRRFVEVDDTFHVSLKEGTKVYENYHNLSNTISKNIPVLNCVECLKDECLKKRKVATPRLFDVLPFEHNILLREYFLSFSAFLQHCRIQLPCCIGVNVYSREWTTLYDRLREYSDTGLNCDYSKFDGYISHQIYGWLAATINRLYRDGVEANAARNNLLLMFIGRRSICGGQVYMVNGGMPSGCAFTAMINSLFNEILIRYVFRKCTPAPMKNFFNSYVRLMVYGDDNLISIKEEAIPYFDGPIIKNELAQVGVIITDGTDKTSPTLQRKPLESLDFLKRGFRRLSTGIVIAPLDKTSLYTRLYYSTAGDDGYCNLDVLRANVKSFLEEIVLHPNHVNEFFRVRSFFLKKIPAWADFLPTYAAAQDFHYRQQQTQSPYLVPRILETRPMGTEYKMMAGQDNHDNIVWLTSRVAICGPKYPVPSGPLHFVVALSSFVRTCERGVNYKVDIAEGSGQLPTQSWTDSFSSSKKRTALHTAYGDGATIYFRSVMPYYSSWCAAGRFLKSQGISTSSVIALFEQYKPANAGNIAPLLATKEYRRYSHRPIFDLSSIKQHLAAS